MKWRLFIVTVFITAVFITRVVFAPFHASSEQEAAKTIQRIITLSPNTTELAFSAGLGDKIIAVSEHSDFPPQVQSLETVANFKGINLERIIALKPDLVITTEQLNMRQLDKLEQLGIEVYSSSVASIHDIADEIEHMSQWAGAPLSGEKNAEQFRQQLAEIQAKYQNSQTVRYFYQVSDSPLMSVSNPHWPTDVFNFCGGVNIMPASHIPYPQLSIETLIQGKPDVIIASKLSENLKPWTQIPAVKNQQILSIDPDLLSRPTMRSLQALEQTCAYFADLRR